MLNLDILPRRPSTEKAIWNSTAGVLFGTLTTMSAQQGAAYLGDRGDGISALELLQPDVFEFMKQHSSYELLPKDEEMGGWRINSICRDDDYGVATFAGFALMAPHYWDFVHPHGGHMPEEILFLLSGNLQTGEGLTLSNYWKYLRLRDLKFLPFLITRKHYRFFVYLPTEERVAAAIVTFQRVLEIMRGLEKDLRTIVALAYALVRLDEIEPTVGADSILTSKCSAQRDLAELINEQPSLGFVYQRLRGSQDAVTFKPDIYST